MNNVSDDYTKSLLDALNFFIAQDKTFEDTFKERYEEGTDFATLMQFTNDIAQGILKIDAENIFKAAEFVAETVSLNENKSI